MASFNSMGSRSFRENVLTQSIASFFNRQAKANEVPERVLTATPVSSISEPAQISTEKPPTVTEMPSPVDSDSSNRAQIPEKLKSYDGAGEDPLAGGVEGGVEYKTMKWWHAGLVMIAETISLGILSLPAALSVLGLVPGIILLVGLGIMSSYTGYVIWQFKMRYPYIYSVAEAGEVLFGPWGREVLGWGALLFYVFVMGSHILTFSIMMNAVTGHGACTVVFMVSGMLLSFLLTIPRTLKGMRWLCFISFASVILAVGITAICVAVTRPGWALNEYLVLEHNITLWRPEGATFHKAFLAASNIVFAYAGHVAFFQFIAELREPEEFPKSLAMLQISDISLYIVSAVVIYWYSGNQVTSPALDSATPIVRKIAYGIALPTITIAGVVNGHVAVKWVFVKLLKNNQNDLMHQNSLSAWAIWIGIGAGLWVLSWLIAEVVPVFNDLLGLTSALFASWFTFGLSGMFWVKLYWGEKWNWKNWVLFMVALLNILVASLLCGIGLYASITSIMEKKGSVGPFSCTDNSGMHF